MARRSQAKHGVTRAINDILGGLPPLPQDLEALRASGYIEQWGRRIDNEHHAWGLVWSALNPTVLPLRTGGQ